MGSGPRHKGIPRGVVGGMSEDGRPMLNCPYDGQVEAQVVNEAGAGKPGRLSLQASRILLTADIGVVATVAAAAENERLRACLRDGFSYVGTLEELEGRWLIRYQQG